MTMDDVHKTNSKAVIASVMTLTPLSTLFVGARVYSCFIILRRRLYLEEWLCAISLVFLWLGAAFATKLSLSGGGRHWAVLTDAQRGDVRFWYWLWTLPAGFILSVPNMAVVSLLCRLFQPRRWEKAVLWASAIVCNVNFVLGSVLQLFRCRTLRAPWDAGDVSQVVCLDSWLRVYIGYCFYAAAYSGLADLCLAVYPSFVLHQLTWSRKKKITLSFMLGLSVFATGVACYKTPLLRNIASDDFSYDISALIIWTMVEGHVILIAACVPTLHPLYDQLAEVFSRKQCQLTIPSSEHTDNDRRHHRHHYHHYHHRRLQCNLQFCCCPTLKPSTGAGSSSSGSRVRIVSRGGGTAARETREVANLRTLEDAANLAYPPAVIWKQTVRVGQHSRIRKHEDSFYPI